MKDNILTIIFIIICIIGIIGSAMTATYAQEPQRDKDIPSFPIEELSVVSGSLHFPLWFNQPKPETETPFNLVEHGFDEDNYLYTVNDERFPPTFSLSHYPGHATNGDLEINLQYHPEVNLITRFLFDSEEFDTQRMTAMNHSAWDLLDPDTLKVVGSIGVPAQETGVLDIHDIKWSPDGTRVSIMLLRQTDHKIWIHDQAAFALDFVLIEYSWPGLEIKEYHQGLGWWNVEQSSWPFDPSMPYDYTHVNSLDYHPTLRHMLISSRHLSEVMNVNMDTGVPVWRLGGPNNDFTFVNDGGFSYQHTAEWIDDDTVMIFDNANLTGQKTRVVVYDLDYVNFTATKVKERLSGSFSVAQGGAYAYKDGTTLVSWGMCRRNAPNCHLMSVLNIDFDEVAYITVEGTDTRYATYRLQKIPRGITSHSGPQTPTYPHLKP